MNKRAKKLDLIKKNTFSSKDALVVGLTYYELSELVRVGSLEKEGRGVFLKKDTERNYEVDSYAVALAQMGEPSSLCLWSALAFHQLTEEVPAQVWVYVPYEKTTRLKTLKIIRKRNPFWNIGIDTYDGIRITNIERTLVDAMADKKHFKDAQSFRMILAAIRKKKTSLMKLLNMANKLKVDKRLKRDLLLLQDTYV